MTRSLPKILIHVTAVVLVLAGAAVAIASRSGGESPPPEKPLAQAVGDALSAPAPEGVSGRIEFTNNVVDVAALPNEDHNALLAGATGRFWVAGDGRARLELQSLAGDAQVRLDGDRVEVYDPASNTVYTAVVPLPDRDEGAVPGVADLQRTLGGLARAWSIGDAEPGTVAGESAYTVRISPRHDGGLLGAAEIAWDAQHGVPLRAAVYAQGEREPVLELKATDIEFGPVAESDVAIKRPEGARVVEFGEATAGGGRGGAQGGGHVGRNAGAAAVQAQLSFPLSAPDSLAGLPRKTIRTLRSDGQTGALVTYGKGLGALLVTQAPATGDRGGLSIAGVPGLQELSIDGATGYELATALGTMIQFERDGVTYMIAGSVPPAAAEAAARAL
jgi:outer membrane lipoprotein-sorting protein